MDSLLVRAKRKDNNEWVTGYYVWFKRGNEHYIYSNEKRGTFVYKVIPETICRNTGFYDSKGNELWEHDIVKNIPMHEEYGEIHYAEIVYVDLKGMWMLREKLEYNGQYVTDCELYNITKYAEKVGSKFDYPELLEG